MSLASGLMRDVPGIKDAAQQNADKELIKDLDQLFQKAKEDRLPFERQWLINLAFYDSQQWVWFNEITRRLERPKVPKYRVLMVLNFIRSIVGTKYAKLNQQRPQGKAQPASNDPDDENKAKVCDAILEYLDSIDGSAKAQKRALLWAIVTGTGILKAYWNKSAGAALTYPATTMIDQPDPLTGQLSKVEAPHPKAGQQVKDKNGDTVYLGEVEVTECSPFEFYPDPFGLTMDDKSWVFTQKMRSNEYVMERYGVDVPPTEIAADQYVEGQLQSITGNGDAAMVRSGVVVREFFQRSTKKYPEGRYVVYVASQILYQGPNPYPKAQIPYTAFVDIPVPGRFWGQSTVTDLIDPQKNLNKSRSQSIEQRNLMAKGKWAVAKGALDVGKTITSAPGEVIEYNLLPGAPDGGRPFPIPGQPISESFWKDIQHSISELREVSGSHEVSNAGVPGGVHAAMAIRWLQEQDDLRLGPAAEAYETAIGELGEIKLRLCKQFYEEPRTARIVGKDNSVKVVEFYKDDIPDDVDVHVQAGAALPKSRLARQHYVFELWDKFKGMIDFRLIVRMLDLGDFEGVYDEFNRDVAHAERENDKMKEGVGDPLVEDFHNHQVHIQEHNKFRKGEEYEQLDPALRGIFAQHVAQHEQFVQQLAMQAAMLGGAGAPGAPATGAAAALPAAAGHGGGHQAAPPPSLTGDMPQSPEAALGLPELTVPPRGHTPAPPPAFPAI